jgi:hypothetical protein
MLTTNHVSSVVNKLPKNFKSYLVFNWSLRCKVNNVQVIKVQSQTEEVIPEMILLDFVRGPITASPLRRPIGPRSTERALSVYAQHFNMHTHLKTNHPGVTITVALNKNKLCKPSSYFNNPCLGIQKCKCRNRVYWCFHCIWSTAIPLLTNKQLFYIFPLNMNRSVPWLKNRGTYRNVTFVYCYTPTYNTYYHGQKLCSPPDDIMNQKRLRRVLWRLWFFHFHINLR